MEFFEIQKAQEEYERLLPGLYRYRGQYVAIEPISKEYFIAISVTEALLKGRARYPGREFFLLKIGEEPEGVIEKRRR